MSLKNDSHKSGTNARNTKSNTTNTAKDGTPTKGGKNVKATNNKAAQPTREGGSPTLHASDIRNLVQNHGRAQIGGQELALKTPSWNDSALQAIINDPKFTARAKGQSTADGKLTYELQGHGKTVNVTIGR